MKLASHAATAAAAAAAIVVAVVVVVVVVNESVSKPRSKRDQHDNYLPPFRVIDVTHVCQQNDVRKHTHTHTDTQTHTQYVPFLRT